MNNKYQIRHIAGTAIFVKKICHNVWLFNDVFVSIFDGYELTDDAIFGFLDAKNDEFFPYGGAENDCVIGLSLSATSDDVIEGQYKLHDLGDDIFVRRARRAYGEYKSWAGI